MTIDLSGKTVLITGASRGIGRAIAQQMGEAGARVAVHYNRNQEEAEALAASLDGARAFQADLSDTEATARLFEEVVDAFERLDVLVNNAGVARFMPLDDPVDDWEREWSLTMAVNLRAVELLCRLAIQHFRDHDHEAGRIINVASRAAFRGDEPEYITYASSKAGVVALTRSIARHLGTDGIVAFTLAPGFTRTDMAQDFIDEYGEDHALGDIALPRLTEPEDIAPLAVFLASGLADHATGATIDVNAASYVH